MVFSPADQVRWVSIRPEAPVRQRKLASWRGAAATLQSRRVSGPAV